MSGKIIESNWVFFHVVNVTEKPQKSQKVSFWPKLKQARSYIFLRKNNSAAQNILVKCLFISSLPPAQQVLEFMNDCCHDMFMLHLYRSGSFQQSTSSKVLTKQEHYLSLCPLFGQSCLVSDWPVLQAFRCCWSLRAGWGHSALRPRWAGMWLLPCCSVVVVLLGQDYCCSLEHFLSFSAGTDGVIHETFLKFKFAWCLGAKKI